MIRRYTRRLKMNTICLDMPVNACRELAGKVNTLAVNDARPFAINATLQLARVSLRRAFVLISRYTMHSPACVGIFDVPLATGARYPPSALCFHRICVSKDPCHCVTYLWAAIRAPSIRPTRMLILNSNSVHRLGIGIVLPGPHHSL